MTAVPSVNSSIVEGTEAVKHFKYSQVFHYRLLPPHKHFTAAEADG